MNGSRSRCGCSPTGRRKRVEWSRRGCEVWDLGRFIRPRKRIPTSWIGWRDQSCESRCGGFQVCIIRRVSRRLHGLLRQTRSIINGGLWGPHDIAMVKLVKLVVVAVVVMVMVTAEMLEMMK